MSRRFVHPSMVRFFSRYVNGELGQALDREEENCARELIENDVFRPRGNP
jgi:hypothetical protein